MQYCYDIKTKKTYQYNILSSGHYAVWHLDKKIFYQNKFIINQNKFINKLRHVFTPHLFNYVFTTKKIQQYLLDI